MGAHRPVPLQPLQAVPPLFLQTLQLPDDIGLIPGLPGLLVPSSCAYKHNM